MPVTLVGTVQNNADSATGWSNGSTESELYYQGTACIGAKVGNGTTRFMHTGTARDFSVGGANEGDHILVNFGSLTPGKLDILANGGIRISVSRNFTTTALERGDWYVDGSDTKSPTTLFLPYIIDPAKDFDVVGGGGTYTITANPGQLNNNQSFGVTVTATSGIMGNFNNALVDQLTIGTGLESTGTVTFQDFVDTDVGTVGNRWGWITTNSGVIFMQGRFFVGTSATSSNLTDSLKTIKFPDVPVAADFMGLTVLNAASVLDLELVSLSNDGGAEFDLDLKEGTSTLKTCPIVGCRLTETNANTTLDGCVYANSGPIVLNTASNLTSCSFSSPSTTPMIRAETADSLDNISGCSFDGSSSVGHGIEIQTAGTYNLDAISASSFGADDTATSFINNTSGGTVTLNLLNGTVGSGITVNPSASTTVIQSVALTIQGLTDDTQVVIRNTVDDSEMYFDSDVGVDGSTTYSYGAAEVGIAAMIVIMSLNEEASSVPITLPGQDQTITLLQTNDRTYFNP